MTLWIKLLAFAVGATALVGVFFYITDAEDAKEERDALRGRIENLTTSQEIDNAIRSMDDADFGADIDGRLSGDDG